MATMKDIAKKAGVSYGTVSNVLNKRGNTSLKKIKLVEEAAKELGYFYNENASSLRMNKKNDIALILPTLDNYFFRKIFNLLNNKLNKLSLYVTNFNPSVEIELVNNSIKTKKYLIIVSCLGEDTSFYQSLSVSDTYIIFINSYPCNNKAFSYISLNYDQFFKDINEFIVKNNFKKVLFFSDKKIKPSNLIGTTVIIENSSLPSNTMSIAIEQLYQDDYDLIVTTSYEIFQAVNNARIILQKNDHLPIISIVDNDIILDFSLIPYYQDTDSLIKSIIQLIKKPEMNEQSFIPFTGFLEETKIYNKNEAINILLISNPSAQALIKIKPYIEKKIGIKLNITLITYNEYDLLLDEKYVQNYDLIRIDMAHLPQMASTLFMPLNHTLSSFKEKFIENLDEYIYVDDIAYTLPFDISSMVLMYRKDIFDNQLIQRQYYEETKKHLFVPKNFTEYNHIEQFFNKNYHGVLFPSTTCIGSSITASNEFLLRVNKGHIFEEETLNINDADIKYALESYMCSVKSSKNKNNQFWDDVINEYAEGNTVMSIVYSNYIHMLNSHKDILFKTNFIKTPSDTSYIGGGVIGLTKYTKKEKLVYKFLEVLYSDEICKLLTHLGASMPTKNIYDNLSLTENYPWLKLLPEALKDGKRKRCISHKKEIEIITFEKSIGRQVRELIKNNS